MKLQDQVCTEEQSTTLLNLGITAPSTFVSFKAPSHSGIVLNAARLRHVANACGQLFAEDEIEFTPVYNVAELGIMLNSETHTSRTGTESSQYANWEWCYEDRSIAFGPYATEAEARAEMLIYCIEHGITSVEDANKRLTS